MTLIPHEITAIDMVFYVRVESISLVRIHLLNLSTEWNVLPVLKNSINSGRDPSESIRLEIE